MKKTAFFSALAALMVTSGAYAYDLTVSAGFQNQVVSGSKSYAIPQGTTNITLLYNVYSQEYPHYVTAQSIFNDVWSLSLAGSNGVLYDITRQVNSQLTQEPTWLPNSTTGDIRKDIDVSALTINGPATLMLIATAMNVGDSSLPTIVHASIEPPPLLTITTANPDTINTNNGGRYYSIPAEGDANTLQRYFTLGVTKGDNITLENISVTVLGSGDLMDVIHQLSVPSSNAVQVLSQSSTNVNLRVRVTIQTPLSNINGNPPPTRDLAYRFKIEGKDSNGNTVTDQETVTGKRSLWRTTDVLPGRYNRPGDDGNDDWGASGTYSWLQQNSNLITRVDDISGEHGRNIGHNTHQYGTDIDIYHFYQFAGAGSGTNNYCILKNAVETAFGTLLANGNPNPNPPLAATNAFNNVAAWINATRTGLSNLAALNTVSHLYYANGTRTPSPLEIQNGCSPQSSLPNAWASSLITTGMVTRTVNSVPQTLNLGLVYWNNDKVTYNSVHNNHIHITLDRQAIGE